MYVSSINIDIDSDIDSDSTSVIKHTIWSIKNWKFIF